MAFGQAATQGFQSSAEEQAIIVVDQPGDGVFVYSPVIGPGNLIASIANSDGTDASGNAYLQGITDYQEVSPTDFRAVNIVGGSIAWNQAPGFGGPWTEYASIGFQFTTAGGGQGGLILGDTGLGVAIPSGICLLSMPDPGAATGTLASVTNAFNNLRSFMQNSGLVV